MPYYVRMMRKEDIPKVSEIDREAFPTQQPPANYDNELQNRLARYIVAYTEVETDSTAETSPSQKGGVSRLASQFKKIFNNGYNLENEPAVSGSQNIVGFAGIWVLVDEAHITNLAVRKKYQGQGIGGLLLISIIDLAAKLKATNITLEVRASNTAAQNLYHKFAFAQVGLRRGYYLDNHEDGVLMSTEVITSTSFQAHLQKLKKDHSRKYGVALYQLTENYPFYSSKQ